MIDPRLLFASLFDAAVAAADPAAVIRGFLPARPRGRTVVVGAGKASARMAAAFEAAWDGPLEGAVVTRHGQKPGQKPGQKEGRDGGEGAAPRRIEVIEAAHPVPDAAGLDASARLFAAVRGLAPDDLVVALVSGGGSALLPSPPSGMSLADEIAVNEALLASGAPIAAMNTVRKHLSTIKGGRLALAAHPAKVVTLVVSDIPGDNPAFVASGPTVPDRAGRKDALAIVEDYGLALPEVAIRHLRTPAADAPLPDDPRLSGNEVHVVASAARALEAAAREAARRGVEAVILSDAIEGEARDIAGMHAAIAREIALRDRPFRKPVLLLSGGETTVTVRNKEGRGGRNGEFLLAFALAVDGCAGIDAFAADTDGIDGTGDNAGAFADGATAARMRAAGLDPRAALARNDSWSAFHAVGGLFAPGPTGTNVNDLRAVLVR